MIKQVFCIGIFLVCIASPFSVQERLSFLVSGGIATAFAAEGHEDKAQHKKKNTQKRHKQKDQESFDKHDDADDDSKNREGSTEGKGGSDNGKGSLSPPPPTPPGPTPPPPAPTMDTIPPVIIPPANITQEATSLLSPVVLGAASVTDNVSTGLSATASPSGPYPLGVATVIWSATDAAGNVGTATQTVSITDSTSPLISIQQRAVTVEALAPQSFVNLGVVSASDIVDGTLTPTSNAPAVFPLGVTQVLWTVTDAAGNTATATQNVVVQDTIPPVITAPAAITVDSTAGQPIAVAIGQATATDTFTPVSISNNAPTVFPIGITTVTWTATDANGNSATVMQTVTVNDTSIVAGLPPDPGPAGEATLAGIDSDNDGVRDDVQRWIALTYPSSQKTREALKQSAIAEQLYLLDSANPKLTYAHAIEVDRASECLAYVQPINFYQISREMDAVFYNTSLRSRVLFQADHLMSGKFFNGLPDPKQGCNFEPDLLPN